MWSVDVKTRARLKSGISRALAPGLLLALAGCPIPLPQGPGPVSQRLDSATKNRVELIKLTRANVDEGGRLYWAEIHRDGQVFYRADRLAQCREPFSGMLSGQDALRDLFDHLDGLAFAAYDERYLGLDGKRKTELSPLFGDGQGAVIRWTDDAGPPEMRVAARLADALLADVQWTHVGKTAHGHPCTPAWDRANLALVQGTVWPKDPDQRRILQAGLRIRTCRGAMARPNRDAVLSAKLYTDEEGDLPVIFDLLGGRGTDTEIPP
jgi:hypothetical protein